MLIQIILNQSNKIFDQPGIPGLGRPFQSYVIHMQVQALKFIKIFFLLVGELKFVVRVNFFRWNKKIKQIHTQLFSH